MHPILKQEIVDHLPADIDEITQYFGSMVALRLSVRGGWKATLRFDLCDWTLTQDGVVTADSSSVREVNNPVIEPLEADQLVSFEWKRQHVFEVTLSSGARFSLAENLDVYEPEDTLFTLWVKDEYGMEYSPKSGFRTGLA